MLPGHRALIQCVHAIIERRLKRSAIVSDIRLACRNKEITRSDPRDGCGRGGHASLDGADFDIIPPAVNSE